MKNYGNLSQYLKLSLTEKLKFGLLPDAGMKLPKNFLNHKIVDLRKVDKQKKLTFEKNIPNYFLRDEVARRLLLAAEMFSQKGYTLHLHEVYRSLKKQTREFNEISQLMKEKYPDLSPKKLWQKITEFIADPKTLPPHCTGAAIDLELTRNGKPVDFGTKINQLTPRANLATSGLTVSQKANRKMLLEVMMSQGFAPLAAEWWHFSYGDRNWAAFYNCPIIYDVIDIN